MSEEEKIKQEIEEKFDYLKGKVAVKRRGRLSADIALEKLDEVLGYAVRQMRFEALSAITGMDAGDSFRIIYHLTKEGRVVLNLNVSINKEAAVINTITPYFPSADIYEREIVDLLGIRFDGLAPGNRYPLPDNWPKNEYPLRKDWKSGSTYQ